MHPPVQLFQSSFARRCLLALIGLLPAGPLVAAEEPVAVFAQVFNGYKRARLADESFKPETYVFGEGGSWTRPVKDSGMEEMTFLRVAQSVAAPLARMNYRPAPHPAEAELMILVYWGSTLGSRETISPDTITRFTGASSALAAIMGPEQAQKNQSTRLDPAAAAAESAYNDSLWQLSLQNQDRDHLDDHNARILGYTDELDRARFASHTAFSQDILSELGANRYFVVLQAYDFKTAAKEKKLKPLWTARISMSEGRDNFSASLDQMLRNSARYLGQDSSGLRRDVTREGRVKVGPTEVIGTVPEK